MHFSFAIAITLGVIEGITEFLPISSTGHMIIVSHFLEFQSKKINLLIMIIQLGSTISIIVSFYKEWLTIISTSFQKRFLFLPKINIKSINIFHIFLTMFPTVFFGVLFHNGIKLLINLNYILYNLILGNLLLLISQYTQCTRKIKTFSINDITLTQSMIIGCFQCLALLPGFSRSGATISGAILVGLTQSTATKFSFIISVPILLGACFFDLINEFNLIEIKDLPIFFIGFCTSFIVSIVVVKKLIYFIQHCSLSYFIIYRCIICIILHLLFY